VAQRFGNLRRDFVKHLWDATEKINAANMTLTNRIQKEGIPQVDEINSLRGKISQLQKENKKG
jgi:hypothetical protein